MISRLATPRLIYFVMPLALVLGLLSVARWALLADDNADTPTLPRAATTAPKTDTSAATSDAAARSAEKSVGGESTGSESANNAPKPTSLVVTDNAAKEAAAEAAAASAQLLTVSKTTPTSLADLILLQNAIQQAEKIALPATVGIRIRDTFGSGIVVTEDGYVLTAGHVVGRPNRDATIIFPDGKKVNAKTRGVNRDMDSGLLKITAEGKYPHVEMGHSSELKLGQWLIALGHPNGLTSGRPPVLRAGRVLYSRSDAIQTDDTIVAGDSGGPLLDLAGRVVGIHSRISENLAGNYHVPIDTYRDTWDRLVHGDSWGMPMPGGPLLGVDGQDVAKGCKVTDVYPHTPATQAGIKVGDIITNLGNEKVVGLEGLRSALEKCKPGDSVTVTVLRGDDQVDLKATLVERE